MSTIVTNEAIITMKDGILMSSGITFLKSEINRFARASTTVVDNPIPIPFIAEVVTASVGHIPRTITSVGFSFTIPLKSRSRGVFSAKFI